ncbi:3-hydroxyacyl-CoA dehydrogenase NAD-binding domain-containing protein [Granulicella tundricola]|uniref:3-hydroxyacyl-CoA dehydrogenase NAD-binding protein n=1 Tax=Granulicella tundricola (strain ATCC BAA-1859 / DSM 23138 / MP5ACTX9) TaxID=1198114 RepID=E8X4D8_GRATM|nr:3-hydroxyacyl-CoA dehydrogenase NAD-binding domain-containing protein [Granulicella tundricola]ADW68265.1 3-hydroxyacyl-CoA dehydrogenase NAD-binding protein [Granulicella tundricola MP5ACTX9]
MTAPEISPSKIKVAIIGAGTSGRHFALACATAGFSVVLEDVMPAKLRHAESDFSSLGLTVGLALTIEDAVREADIAVDFVPDDLESKLEIYSMLDRMAPPKTILCTPSQVLSITDLASCTYRPDRCIMFRGDPIPASPVRLLLAAATSPATQALAHRLFTTLGHPVHPEPDPDLPQLLKNMNTSKL